MLLSERYMKKQNNTIFMYMIKRKTISATKAGCIGGIEDDNNKIRYSYDDGSFDYGMPKEITIYYTNIKDINNGRY